VQTAMSALGKKRTIVYLFENLVGAQKKSGWN